MSEENSLESNNNLKNEINISKENENLLIKTNSDNKKYEMKMNLNELQNKNKYFEKYNNIDEIINDYECNKSILAKKNFKRKNKF